MNRRLHDQRHSNSEDAAVAATARIRSKQELPSSASSTPTQDAAVANRCGCDHQARRTSDGA